MLKWIILGIIFYVIVGFSTCLIVQIHDSNVRDPFNELLFDDGHVEPVEIFFITTLWPMFTLYVIVAFVIPKLFMSIYKLFVLIIFSIGALFTKGDKRGK